VSMDRYWNIFASSIGSNTTHCSQTELSTDITNMAVRSIGSVGVGHPLIDGTSRTSTTTTLHSLVAETFVNSTCPSPRTLGANVRCGAIQITWRTSGIAAVDQRAVGLVSTARLAVKGSDCLGECRRVAVRESITHRETTVAE
jgi:hypothetical protein